MIKKRLLLDNGKYINNENAHIAQLVEHVHGKDSGAAWLALISLGKINFKQKWSQFDHTEDVI